MTLYDRKWCRFTGSHLELPLGRKFAYTVSFTSYKAVARRGGSHVTGNDVTWPHVTWSDPDVTWFDRKLPGSGCRSKTRIYCEFHFLQGCSSGCRSKTRIYCESHFLQGCSSPGKAITWRQVTESDPDVASFSRKSPGSGLEGRQLTYTVSFTSSKAISRRGWQSRDRKWRHVTLREWKWPASDVILPEVTWKWL